MHLAYKDMRHLTAIRARIGVLSHFLKINIPEESLNVMELISSSSGNHWVKHS